MSDDGSSSGMNPRTRAKGGNRRKNRKQGQSPKPEETLLPGGIHPPGEASASGGGDASTPDILGIAPQTAAEGSTTSTPVNPKMVPEDSPVAPPDPQQTPLNTPIVREPPSITDLPPLPDSPQAVTEGPASSTLDVPKPTTEGIPFAILAPVTEHSSTDAGTGVVGSASDHRIGGEARSISELEVSLVDTEDTERSETPERPVSSSSSKAIFSPPELSGANPSAQELGDIFRLGSGIPPPLPPRQPIQSLERSESESSEQSIQFKSEAGGVVRLVTRQPLSDISTADDSEPLELERTSSHLFQAYDQPEEVDYFPQELYRASDEQVPVPEGWENPESALFERNEPEIEGNVGGSQQGEEPPLFESIPATFDARRPHLSRPDPYEPFDNSEREQKITLIQEVTRMQEERGEKADDTLDALLALSDSPEVTRFLQHALRKPDDEGVKLALAALKKERGNAHEEAHSRLYAETQVVAANKAANLALKEMKKTYEGRSSSSQPRAVRELPAGQSSEDKDREIKRLQNIIEAKDKDAIALRAECDRLEESYDVALVNYSDVLDKSTETNKELNERISKMKEENEKVKQLEKEVAQTRIYQHALATCLEKNSEKVDHIEKLNKELSFAQQSSRESEEKLQSVKRLCKAKEAKLEIEINALMSSQTGMGMASESDGEIAQLNGRLQQLTAETKDAWRSLNATNTEFGFGQFSDHGLDSAQLLDPRTQFQTLASGVGEVVKRLREHFRNKSIADSRKAEEHCKKQKVRLGKEIEQLRAENQRLKTSRDPDKAGEARDPVSPKSLGELVSAMRKDQEQYTKETATGASKMHIRKLGPKENTQEWKDDKIETLTKLYRQAQDKLKETNTRYEGMDPPTSGPLEQQLQAERDKVFDLQQWPRGERVGAVELQQRLEVYQKQAADFENHLQADRVRISDLERRLLTEGAKAAKPTGPPQAGGETATADPEAPPQDEGARDSSLQEQLQDHRTQLTALLRTLDGEKRRVKQLERQLEQEFSKGATLERQVGDERAKSNKLERRIAEELIDTAPLHKQIEKLKRKIEKLERHIADAGAKFERERAQSKMDISKLQRLLKKAKEESIRSSKKQEIGDKPVEITIDFALLRCERALRSMVDKRSVRGFVYGDTEESVDAALLAVKLSEEKKDDTLIARSSFWAGVAYYYSDNPNASLEHFKRAEKLPQWNSASGEHSLLPVWIEVAARRPVPKDAELYGGRPGTRRVGSYTKQASKGSVETSVKRKELAGDQGGGFSSENLEFRYVDAVVERGSRASTTDNATSGWGWGWGWGRSWILGRLGPPFDINPQNSGYSVERIGVWVPKQAAKNLPGPSSSWFNCQIQ